MKALKLVLAGGAALAALTVAAPASAQYYPGYGYGYGSPYGSGYGSGYGYGSPYGSGYGYGSPYGTGYGYGSPYGYGSGGIIGQVISSVIGGGMNSAPQRANPFARYGQQGQFAISQCMGAANQRLNAGYGNNQGARVLGVSDLDPRTNGGFTVRGVANSGRSAGYGYNGQTQVDLTFKCKTDSAGYVVDVDVEPAISVNGQVSAPAYTPYNQDYSQYGYRRY